MSVAAASKKRNGYRLNAQKLVTSVSDAWTNRASQKPDRDELVVIREKLQKYETALDSLNKEIEAQVDPDQYDNEFAKSLQIEESIWEAVSRVGVMLEEANQTPASVDGSEQPSNGSCANKNAHVKLPKLELTKFDGNPLTWQEFWDGFESTIHNNAELSTIDKFKYLKTYLSGEALHVADGFRLTTANYDEVVESLKERFGNNEVAVFAHFERLLSFPVASMDTRSLQTAYDECEKHVRSLVALGLEEATFGQVFTPIILSKLPRPIRVEMHRQQGSKPWTLASLRELLRDEIKARLMGDWSLSEKGKVSNEEKGKSDTGSKFGYRAKSHVPSTGALVQNAKSLPNCSFCKANHYADQCKKFPTVEARKLVIKGHCYKCLGKGHSFQACPKTNRCYHCQENSHHRSLCPKKFSKPQSSTLFVSQHSRPNPYAQEYFPQEKVAESCVNGSAVYMQMAVVRMPQSGSPARIFLDNGSSCSYITSSMVKALKLKPNGQVTISNARFEDRKRRIRMYQTVGVRIPALDGSVITLSALVTDAITCPIQKLPIDTEKFPILKQIQLADPPINYTQSVPIDILVGRDHYFDIVGSEQIKLENGLVLLGSKLGYITAGRAALEAQEDCSFINTMFAFSQEHSPLPPTDIERFWRLEDIGVKGDYSQKDDELAVQCFNQSIELVDGRYQVGWPWKSENPELPENYTLALSRLRSLLRRIDKDEAIFQTYDDTIRNQLKAGVVEEAASIQTENLVHYIPHHCVVKPDRATTKLRIVYDASARAHKSLFSLNDCLLRGPVFLEDLCGLLMRFRTYPIAMIADIEKAFLQVTLQPSDRDVTRFLWLKDRSKPLSEENLLVLRFRRVPFGVISSPFLLAATVKHHLLQQGTKVAQHIASNIYVDNAVCGSASVQEAIDIYREAKQLFSQISMNIREWQQQFQPSCSDPRKGPRQW